MKIARWTRAAQMGSACEECRALLAALCSPKQNPHLASPVKITGEVEKRLGLELS